MKTILLWDPRFPDRRPARLTVEDTVASAAVRAGVAAAVNPAEAGALLAGGALDPGTLTEVALQHGSGDAIRRVFIPYSVALVGGAAGVLAAVGAPLAGAPTPPPLPTLTLTGPLTYATNAAAGALVANIGNVPAGVAPTLTPNDGRLVIAGNAGAWTVVTGLSASTAGTITLAVAATGATGASAGVTVTALNEILATTRLNAPGWNGYYSSDGVDTNSTDRIAWVNETGANITEMKCALGNWLLQPTSERAGYNDIRAGMSIEYPAGTFTVFPFSGSTGLVTIPPTGTENTKKSDAATLATPIPPGATAFMRPYVEVDAGGKWPQALLINTAAGESVEFNGGDKRAGGTVTNATPTATRRGFAPISLMVTGWTGTLRGRATIGLGDSYARGDGGLELIGGGLGYMALAAAGNYPHLNWGFTGTKAQDNQPASMVHRLNALSKGLGVTAAILSYGDNDAAAGRTGQQIYDDYMLIATALNAIGLKVVAPTLPPRVTSTTGYFTTAGQTPIAGYEATRTVFNAKLRLKPTPFAAVIELGDAVEPARDAGVWTNGDTTNNPHLLPSIPGTVAAGSTTTVINTNLTTLGANDLRFGGGILFTSGALNGVFAAVNMHTGGGAAITLTTSVAAAPATGDTFKAWRLGSRLTADGVHGAVAATAAAVPPGLGGQFLMADVARTVILSL